MACYPCIHCNKCGMYSATAQTQCANCATPIPIGIASCPQCGGKSFVVVSVDDCASNHSVVSDSPINVGTKG